MANKALIVTKDNKVYSVGKCLDADIFCPKKIEILCGEDIKTITYGSDHVLVLTQQGKVFKMYIVVSCHMQHNIT